MKTEFYIAQRLNSRDHHKSSISRPIIRVAVLGISLGLAVMIIAVSIVTGFQQEISKKVIGFGAHIQILNFDSNKSFETIPITRNEGYQPFVSTIKGIKHMQAFATKAGIIKTRQEIQGVVLKGVDNEYDWNFFRENLVEGSVCHITDSGISNDLLISQKLANTLKIGVGDQIATYFVQQPPRMRRFTICGIYESSLDDFDKVMVMCDLRHIQKLNDWSPEMVSGYEVLINDFNKLDEMTVKVNDLIGYDFFENGSKLKVVNVKEKYPQIFSWLQLLDLNVWIILILMLLVAGINMISGLLVLILERTSMIGILKSLGAQNASIRNIFMIQSGFLISKGLLWGNLIGIGVCLFQQYTHILKLDPSTYYIATVPVNLQIGTILLLNIGTLIITILMMLLPSLIIARISPEKTIKFN